MQESETVDAARRPGRLAGSGMNSDTRAHGERHDGDPIVTVSSGTVRGQRDGTIDRFLGIPYAAPPFGERRFAAPHPPQAGEGERDATQFGPTAPQTAYVGGLEKYLPTVAIAGDDILTLNVWVPAEQSPGGRLPVMVFVHGGAFSRGTSALPAYDGAAFAKHGIVYVSLNYRLGSEGFSVLDGVPQNLGLLDQMAAFAWVRREIAAFGGDPSNITAMGHSAGANALAAILAHPDADAYFDRVILQSGPLSAIAAEKSRRMTAATAKQLGVDATKQAFAANSPADLVTAQTAAIATGSPLGGGPTFALVVGGDAVPRDPMAAFRAGAGRSIPVLIGSTSEEYRLWLVPSGKLDRISWLTVTLARMVTRVSRRTVKTYRENRPGAAPGEILGSISADLLLGRAVAEFADSRVDADAATYVYEFDWRSPVDKLGAAHVMELGFVFDRLASADSQALAGQGAPQQLADEMHAAWVAFVKTGDPGWQRWSRERPTQVYTADGGRVAYNRRSQELALLPQAAR